MSILIVHSVRLRRVASWVDLLATENRFMARYYGLCDSASHPTVSIMEWGRYLIDLFLIRHDFNCVLCLNPLFYPISSAFMNSSCHETVEVKIG